MTPFTIVVMQPPKFFVMENSIHFMNGEGLSPIHIFQILLSNLDTFLRATGVEIFLSLQNLILDSENKRQRPMDRSGVTTCIFLFSSKGPRSHRAQGVSRAALISILYSWSGTVFRNHRGHRMERIHFKYV